MTRRRWIADEVSRNNAALTGAHADHLVRVLRARVGQEFDVATGAVVRHGRIVTIQEGRVEFELGEEIPAATVPNITLLLSIFKFDRMEWAIEKCTELNVTTIVPVIARRTEKHLAQAAEKRVDRWRRIAREAAQQSRRTAAPEVAGPMKLGEALELAADLRIVLAETEKEVQLSDVLRAGEVASVALAVGPEGGWTAEELQKFGKSGWVSASLGTTILRAETAAIAALAIVRAEFG